jgi:sporulation protein YlmC with PRC-barrel domain
MRLDLGIAVHCSDGSFGELADVVVDPVTKRVTHLVVQPNGEEDVSRLVPVGLAEGAEASDDGVSLRCTRAEAQQLENVQRHEYLRLDEVPDQDPNWDVGLETVLAIPYGDEMMIGEMGELYGSYGVIYDRVPRGEVEIQRGSNVVASGGEHLGRVDSLLVDGDGSITDLVMEQRRFLFRKRMITVPIVAVARLDNDTVILQLAKTEVAALSS